MIPAFRVSLRVKLPGGGQAREVARCQCAGPGPVPVAAAMLSLPEPGSVPPRLPVPGSRLSQPQ